MRCAHEMQMHPPGTCHFVTLTYNDDELPAGGSLHYPHYQKFMKRLRRNARQKFRFYMCGEYGDKYGRPHYHAILFGLQLEDLELWRTHQHVKYYRSELVEKSWSHGHVEISEANYKNAAYVARYIMKKVTGDQAEDHYKRIDPITLAEYEVEPEFTRMSLKPGIGATWYEKYATDIFPGDFCIVDGSKKKVPRYYEQSFKKHDPEKHEEIKKRRRKKARQMAKDTTPDRLRQREICAEARVTKLKRELET